MPMLSKKETDLLANVLRAGPPGAATPRSRPDETLAVMDVPDVEHITLTRVAAPRSSRVSRVSAQRSSRASYAHKHRKADEASPVLAAESSPMLDVELSVLDAELSTVLDAELSTVLDVEARPVLDAEAMDAEASPVLDAEASPVLDAEASPVLDAQARPVLDAEACPVLVSKQISSARKTNGATGYNNFFPSNDPTDSSASPGGGTGDAGDVLTFVVTATRGPDGFGISLNTFGRVAVGTTTLPEVSTFDKVIRVNSKVVAGLADIQAAIADCKDCEVTLTLERPLKSRWPEIAAEENAVERSKAERLQKMIENVVHDVEATPAQSPSLAYMAAVEQRSSRVSRLSMLSRTTSLKTGNATGRPIKGGKLVGSRGRRSCGSVPAPVVEVTG